MKIAPNAWKQLLAAGFLLLFWRGGSSAELARTDPSALRPAAQDDAMNFTLQGKISKLEANGFTVASEENMLFHVRYDEKTEIKNQDGSAATAKDLHVGLVVKVEGDLAESGETLARKIEIENGGEKKPPAAAHLR